MWFLVGSVAILVLLIGAAAVSDIRRRSKLRRLNEHPVGRGVSDAFRRSQAGTIVQGAESTNRVNRGIQGTQFLPPPS